MKNNRYCDNPTCHNKLGDIACGSQRDNGLYCSAKCADVGKRPPLGVMPKFIWIEHRIEELKKAIYRYLEADKPVPKEWYEELEDHLKNKTL